MKDKTKFPDPSYKETVLAPLFEGAKLHFSKAVRDINHAHLIMLTQTKIISKIDAGKIAKALSDIDAELDIDALEYTGEYEDYFFLIEAELNQRLGPDLAGALHTARSRNDMDHTVFKTVLAQRLDQFLTLSHTLAQALIDTSEREMDTLIIAYTHGQPAQPSTFGHYLAGVIEVLLRDIERLHGARKLLQKCPMGAAAITTSGFPVDRHMMANLLGFSEPLQNSYSCIAAVDYVTGLYSAIKLMFLHLGRVVQDFQFWSAFEVGQLFVPNSFVQISSIMPQKRNPVPIEHLRLLSSLTIGHCDTIINTMHNTPFTDMNDSEGEVQQAGYSAFNTGARVLKLLEAFVPALTINHNAVVNNINASCITVTELADALVREDGISFRQAHLIAAKTAQDVIAKGQALSSGYSSFSDAFQTETSRTSTLDKSGFQHFVSPENFVAVRNRYGGPANAPMKDAIAGYRTKLSKFVRRSTKYETNRLNAEIKRILSFEKLQQNGDEG